VRRPPVVDLKVGVDPVKAESRVRLLALVLIHKQQAYSRRAVRYGALGRSYDIAEPAVDIVQGLWIDDFGI
jgi:hypothetical protein